MACLPRLAAAARALTVAGAFGIAASTGAEAFVGERVVSAGGIEAWLVTSPDIPVIAMKLSFEGGSALDPDGKEGLADFVAAMLGEGAADMDSRAFQAAISINSISMGFSAGADHFNGSLYTLSENRELAFSLLAKALTDPHFAEEPMARVRQALNAQLQAERRDPGSIGLNALGTIAFADHPYGRYSTPESVAAITADDLHAFADGRFARDALLISVAGDITGAELAPLLDSTFGALPEHASPWEVPDVGMQGSGEIVLVEIDLPQTVFFFAQPGPPGGSEDFHAVNVVNRALGGQGFSSRLFREIRERRGLTYDVTSALAPLSHASLIIGSTSTVNERAGETLEVLLDQWDKMGSEGPSAIEVDDAKLYINGSYALGISNTTSIANALLSYQQLDLPPNYYEVRHELVDAITPESATTAARAWFDAGDLLVVVVGRPVGITPTRVATDALKSLVGAAETPEAGE